MHFSGPVNDEKVTVALIQSKWIKEDVTEETVLAQVTENVANGT